MSLSRAVKICYGNHANYVSFNLIVGEGMQPDELAVLIHSIFKIDPLYRVVGLGSITGALFSLASACIFPAVLVASQMYFVLVKEVADPEEEVHPIYSFAKISMNILKSRFNLSDDAWEGRYYEVLHKLAINELLDPEESASLAKLGSEGDALVLACCRLADAKWKTGDEYISCLFRKIALGIRVKHNGSERMPGLVYKEQSKIVMFTDALLAAKMITIEECIAIVAETINLNMDVMVAYSEYSGGGLLSSLISSFKDIAKISHDVTKQTLFHDPNASFENWRIWSNVEDQMARKNILMQALCCPEYDCMTATDHEIIIGFIDKEHFSIISALEMFRYNKDMKALRKTLLQLPKIVYEMQGNHDKTNSISKEESDDEYDENEIMGIVKCAIRIMRMKGMLDIEQQQNLMDMVSHRSIAISNAVNIYNQNEDMDQLMQELLDLVNRCAELIDRRGENTSDKDDDGTKLTHASTGARAEAMLNQRFKDMRHRALSEKQGST